MTDNSGLQCTVYHGGNGPGLSVEKLKEITKETGHVIIHEKEYDRLKTIERSYTKDASMKWGDTSNWGQNKRSDRSWDIGY